MITIDGSFGEGGGQILRTSLALSLVTGKPFSIHNIRAGRKKPGLMRQHLTAVNAATEIGLAAIEGNRIGSQAFTFDPETKEWKGSEDFESLLPRMSTWLVFASSATRTLPENLNPRFSQPDSRCSSLPSCSL